MKLEKLWRKSGDHRFLLIDTLRGFALVLMTIYHFCFDLTASHLTHFDFRFDLRWIGFRSVILSLFIGLAGASWLLSGVSFGSRAYRRRALRLGVGSLFFTVVTLTLYRDHWIFFGVLHFLFVAGLLSPLLIRSPRLALPLGILFIALPIFYRSRAFGGPLVVSGLAPWAPITLDFVPFFPWIGVALLGVFLGWAARARMPALLDAGMRPLAALGRHSLLYYVTHQIVLVPLAWLVARLLR